MNFFKSKDISIEQLNKLISKKSVTKLRGICEDIGFKGFQNKSKDELVELLLTEPTKLNALVNKSWWSEHHNHIYFLITIILSVVIWKCSGDYSGLIDANTSLQNKNSELLQQEVECRLRYEQLEKTTECRNDFDVTNDEIERIARELENAALSLLDKGNSKFVLGKYNEAIEWWTESSKQGNYTAQLNLGVMYEKGRGVKQDYKIAVEWYRKAANQGYYKAQNNLGTMYFKGKGVKQDFKIAVEWYRKAANQGDYYSQDNLGSMYFKGTGVNQDYSTAFKWYQKAANQGFSIAQYRLGLMYTNGKGVKQDFKIAVEWYRKAANQGYHLAQFNLGAMYEKGGGVKQDYKIAVEWYRKAAEQGYYKAQHNLGGMYAKGTGVNQDYNMAVEWFRKAAEQGDSKSVNYLKQIQLDEKIKK
jgi:TPR repeat protein